MGSQLQLTTNRLTRKPNGVNVRDNWPDTPNLHLPLYYVNSLEDLMFMLIYVHLYIHLSCFVVGTSIDLVIDIVSC